MATTTCIVRLGVDGGIQVPQGLLRAADLGDKVRVRAEPGRLVVTPVESGHEARSGWADAAREMRVAGDDWFLE